ncbi:MAG: UvrD-helicase domain-containing protein [Salinivirgaceae bacterium]|nr:UvrD-helicase domain-containing protein [Salinivirgaceae bacterium]
MSALTICKASAGSGKTFKLTGEYLKLVFNPEINFKNILAVTFTNKATTEMRTRILKAISDIANGRKSDYVGDLCEMYHMTPVKLKERAQILLKKMLNQYSYFKISTIDSFFQQVIKSIAYELELNSGFTLELDDKTVIDNAISRMIDDFGPNSEEGRWILQTISDKIENGKRWEIQNDVSRLAEKAPSVRKDWSEGDNAEHIKKFNDFKKELKKLKDDFLVKVNKTASEGIEIMNGNSFDIKDFYQTTKGAGSYIVRCSTADSAFGLSYNSYVATSLDNPDKMSTNKAKCAEMIRSGLHEVLVRLCELTRSREAELAASAELALANINNLALVDRVNRLQKEICDEQNIFLLKSAMPFLNEMIGDNDAPFIYEKFGYTLNHFMIDEFQDTSTLNWKNFYPLISNKVAEGYPSLIVGDVKQAIYRWRGGDWKLLDNQVQADFDIAKDEIQNLESNWRSCKNIVEFNNWCFKSVSGIVCKFIAKQIETGNYRPEYLEIFSRTYSDATQKVPDKNASSNGFVSVDYLDTTDTDYNTAVAEWVIGQIDRLAELGYQPGDIAILVRSKKEGVAIANCLGQAQCLHPETANRYRFVSNEAVLLGNNQAVRLLVAAMQFLQAPSKIQFQAQLVWLYYAVSKGVAVAAEKIQQTEFGDDAGSVWSQMPDGFSSMKDSFRQLDLIQLSTRLIRAFFGMPHQISASDMPFISEFEDRVQAFSDRNGSNIQLFIDWWAERGFQQAITMNDHQNAIQVMTIHKSKGLEFKAVLLPYLVSTSHGGEILWCPTNEEPFKQFSPIPIPYKKDMAGTIFRDAYYEEEFMKHVDNMNVLYVALTRASHDMRICAAKNSSKGSDFSDAKILNMLYDHCQNDPAAQQAGIVCEEDRMTIGVEQPYVSDAETDSSEEESVPECPTNHAKVSIRCHSEDFFSGIGFDRAERINIGKLYHHIFEYIKYSDDVHKAVMEVVAEGFIPADKVAEYERNISRFVSRQPDWFSQKWNVITEQPIMLPDGEIRRPDRILESDTDVVVIDYKFTSRHNPDYNNQVKVYADALRQLTGKKVSGYLWYVWPDEKVEVVS